MARLRKRQLIQSDLEEAQFFILFPPKLSGLRAFPECKGPYRQGHTKDQVYAKCPHPRMANLIVCEVALVNEF